MPHLTAADVSCQTKYVFYFQYLYHLFDVFITFILTYLLHSFFRIYYIYYYIYLIKYYIYFCTCVVNNSGICLVDGQVSYMYIYSNILFIYTREIPDFGGISLDLRGNGAACRAPTAPILRRLRRR